ncbi:MAG: uracil-DNA glycosylase [Campylobacteraceae bacterium]|nr:uracil-DNA glycosylase [Campylobacteraceae bacterium]
MTKAIKNKILSQLHFLKSIGYEYHEPIKAFNKEVQEDTLPNDMNSLGQIVNNCYLCELSKNRKNVLFGYGNINSKIMFIIDEPTTTEDELDSFYVGKSGEQLAKMIENVLPLKKEDVYITSLVKCKSQNGFESSHFSSCSSYLYKQIDLVDPKLIVSLGDKTYQYLCKDKTPFYQIRGKLMSFKKYDVLPTYSPGFLLRNPSFKKEAFQDMLKIKSILESN